MGRSLSTTMQNIFAGSDRKIDWTLDLTFPDATSFKYATAPLSLAKGEYTNDLEAIGEIRQTLESPIDRLSVAVQNKDRVLGEHLALHWQKWRRAEATIGRYYVGGPTMNLSEWKPMFVGAVQQPEADDFRVTFTVISDVVAPGQIVCNRPLAAACWFIFKDPKTCGYVGIETQCNHRLKSKLGCDGRSNGHRYGGMEHRYNPSVNAPGTGGNSGEPGVPGGPTVPCPELDQYVRVLGENGRPRPKMVGFLTETDLMWNPVSLEFEEIERVEVVRGQPIFEIECQNGARGFSSFSHPVLRHADHQTGDPVSTFRPGDSVLTEISSGLHDTRATVARETGRTGDVLFIVMKGGKIYSYGDDQEKMIVCHNSKPEPPGEF